MDEDGNRRAEELHDEYKRKTLADIKSEVEYFDHNLLAFSSGALGLSLAFIKDVVPLARAIWLPCLFASWIAFVFCILIVLTSLQISIRALEKALGDSEEFYLAGNQEAHNRFMKSFWYKAIDGCTLAASLCFLTGLLCTMSFAGRNIVEAKRMAQIETKVVTVENQKSIKPSSMTPVTPSSGAQQPTQQGTGSSAPAQSNQSSGNKK